MPLTVLRFLRFFSQKDFCRLTLFQFVRCHDPVHIAALLFMIENVSRRRIVPCTFLEDETDNNEILFETKEFQIPSRITLNVSAVETSTNDVLNLNCANIYEKENNINMMQVLTAIQNCNKELYMNEREVSLFLHNLQTNLYYESFLKPIRSLFLNLFRLDHPTSYFSNADRSGIAAWSDSVTYQFVRYHETITSPDNGKRWFVKKKPTRIIDRPINWNVNYVRQPLLQGFRLIVRYDFQNKKTSCFNRMGELVQGFLKNFTSDIDVIFEAILVPIDKHKRMRSWKYWNYRFGEILYITDMLQIRDVILKNVPFERREMLCRKFAANSSHFDVTLDYSSILDSLNDTGITKVYDAIVGEVFRHKYRECVLERKFISASFYDCFAQTNNKMYGPICLYSNDVGRLHFRPEFAEKMTVYVGYGHDDQYLYLCSFHTHRLCYCHIGRVPRHCTYDQEPKYDVLSRPKVLNAKVSVFGIAYVRVYHSQNNECVCYEMKRTTGYYDL